MWHDHPFNQRNNATKRAEEEGLGKKIEKEQGRQYRDGRGGGWGGRGGVLIK